MIFDVKEGNGIRYDEEVSVWFVFKIWIFEFFVFRGLGLGIIFMELGLMLCIFLKSIKFLF